MTEAQRSIPNSPSPATEVLAPTLESLGVHESALLAAVKAGVSGANNVTAFHPITARGFTQWSETVASLRQSLNEEGWTRSNPKNSPRITSPDGRTSIIVIGGNADTGVSADVSPTTSRRRGPATEAAVRSNSRNRGPARWIPGQGVLDIDLVLDMKRNSDPSKTWVLLYHWATDEPVVRAELSLPISIEEGEIKRWEHRILLPAQNVEDFAITFGPAGGPEDDVDFTISERP